MFGGLLKEMFMLSRDHMRLAIADPQLKMPALGLLILGAEVLCVAHVVRTGRPFWWIYLIVFAPLVGRSFI
jgi:hypothetical protein